MIIITISAVIALIVIAIMIYGIWQQRHQQGKYEIFWALIPLLLLIAMLVPTVKILLHRHHTDAKPVISYRKAE